jgi:hypothetical protein
MPQLGYYYLFSYLTQFITIKYSFMYLRASLHFVTMINSSRFLQNIYFTLKTP